MDSALADSMLLRPLSAVCLGLLPVFALAQSPRETRETLLAWIDLQTEIAATRSEWTSEKAIIEDLVALLETEEGRLRERLEGIEADTDVTAERRAELNAEREALLAAEANLAEVVPQLEAATRALYERLPEVLKTDLAQFYNRMPESAEAGEALGTSQRILTLVGLLNRVDRFNSNVTLEAGIRTLDEGSGEVKTLYFGLAGAYFSNASGTYAGRGIPGEDGWTWTSEPELGPDIARLIAVYEGRREATFVNLPLDVQ